MAHILIIDDEEMVRNSLHVMLEHEGHSILEAENGVIGLSLAEQHHPDLIITDIFMPDKDGLEVIRELRQQQSTVKILAITGGGASGSLNLLPQASAFGAHATLHKPFTRRALLQTIQQLLAE